MMENPWADVGRLLPGHIVYRLAKDGDRYDQVPVIRINSHQMRDASEAYGVHLRDGHRSYHANGYLVMVNYPEVRPFLDALDCRIDLQHIPSNESVPLWQLLPKESNRTCCVQSKN